MRKFRFVEREVTRLRADDAKAAKRITERQRHDGFDHRMGLEFFRVGEWNISGRHVDLVNAREDELQRAALGADDHVDAA